MLLYSLTVKMMSHDLTGHKFEGVIKGRDRNRIAFYKHNFGSNLDIELEWGKIGRMEIC